jgi:hypothetical protein
MSSIKSTRLPHQVFVFRGEKVLIDRDLEDLYGVQRKHPPGGKGKRPPFREDSLSESPQNNTHEFSKIFYAFPRRAIHDPKVFLTVFMHNKISKTHRLDHLLR